MAPQAIARSLDVHDDGVVKEPVQQGCGDHRVTEHLAPFGKAAVGGQDHRTSFLLDHGLSLEQAFHQPRLDVSGPDLVTVDLRAPFEVEPPPGAALRRLMPEPSPLLFACPTAVLDHTGEGGLEGMTEPMHPWAAVAAADDQRWSGRRTAGRSTAVTMTSAGTIVEVAAGMR